MEDIIGPKLKAKSCSPMETYTAYLKSKYLEKEMPDYGKWPPSISKKYVNLAVIEKERLSRIEAEEKSKALTYGDVSKIKCKGNIQLADIATPSKDGVLPKFVLVEGAPGVGKSTFAWKACRKWAKGKILTEYELVILIRMRDESVRKATCLGDLIQYPRDPAIHQRVIEEMIVTGGKGVLLLLEGYDELPASLREEGSLFRNVIKGDILDEGTVVVTSRHWASQPLLLPHCSRPVSKHIEILGFNNKNIEDYLIIALKEDDTLLHDLKQYLELNPHIHSMMYIPLNCAIVLEVYRNSKTKDSPIPATMTELYSSLLRSLLLRHIYDLPEYKGKCPELSDLNKLPECIKSHFDNLAKLAYEGICKKDQQIIFTQNEMPSDLNTLGLMQSSMELYVDSGSRKSFNFLHLTIQEFLAAHYLLTFPSTQHVKLLCRESNITLSSVLLLFLAGLSPLALESALSTNTKKYINTSMSLNAIKELFEAKLKLHQKCLAFYEQYFLLEPIHYYMLGSVIANTGCHWDVNISYNYECFRMFTYGITSCENILSKLKLHIRFLSSDAVLFGFYDVQISIELLDLKSGNSNCAIIFGETLGSFFDKLSNDSPLTIKHLQFAGYIFRYKESKKIESFLKRTSSTTILTLHHCNFELEDEQLRILPGECDNIEKLCIELWYRSDDDFCQVLKENRTLKEFNISCRVGFPCELVESLCANSTIKRLVLGLNGKITPFGSNELCLPIDDASTEIIRRNKAVIELSINCSNYIGIEKIINFEVLTQEMNRNTSLQKLEISIPLGVRNASLFASMISGTTNTTLKELHFLKECTIFLTSDIEVQEIFDILSSSLNSNQTLLKMYFALPHSFVANTACANNDRLHCEWYDTNEYMLHYRDAINYSFCV